MFEHLDAWLYRPNFIVFVILFSWGLYIMVVHHNLVKKLIGMYLVQTSVIFYLVTLGVKSGATVPVLLSTTEPMRVEAYGNRLPHVVTLTAIVVGVAVLGVSLALVTAMYRKYGTLDEDEILTRLNE